MGLGAKFRPPPSGPAGAAGPRPDDRWRLWRNVLAALTAVCIVAPECVAFAQLAGIPPELGLVVAPLTIVGYALVGGSRVLYVTPLAATALLTAVTVSGLHVEEKERVAATAAVSLATGIILLITGAARCGFIVRFLRPEAITEFLFGLAVVVIVRELAIASDTDLGEGSAATRAVRLVQRIGQWHLGSIAVAGVTLVLLICLERWLPAIPSTLVVLVAAWGLTVIAGLDRHGIAVVGQVRNTLASLSLPSLSPSDWSDLIGGALGLALICFVLSFGVAIRVARPEDPPLDANREMLALGVSNVLAGLAGGLAGAGSPEASPAARAVGANRRWSTALAAILLFALAGWGSAVFERLPEAALAAVVIAAVRGFISPAPLIVAWKHDRAGFAVALCAVGGVVILGLLQGLLIAVGLSFVLFVATVSRLHVSVLGQLPGTTTYLAVERLPELIQPDGVLVLRPDGGLFFANVDRVVVDAQAAITATSPSPQAVLLDLEASFRLDQPAVTALVRLRQHCARQDIGLHFLHLYLAAADTISDSELADVPVYQDTATAVTKLGAEGGTVAPDPRPS